MKFEDIVLGSKKEIEKFRKDNPDGIVIIWGATATGKSRLSVELAKFFDVEIISSDSRQIFRKMNIGTDKVSKDILDKIPHHQIDIVDPDEKYTAGQWQKDAKRQIKEIQSRGKLPMIVGGTGLYIDTIYKNFDMPEIGPDPKFRAEMFTKEEQEPGFLHKKLLKIDPEEAQKHHPNSTRYIVRALEIFYKTGKTKTETFKEQDVEQPILMIGIWREKEETNKLINDRIGDMKNSGLIKEVKGLLDEGYSPTLQSMGGIGYKEVVGYINGEYDIEKMEELLKKNTQHLAKKQRTWFRRYITDGKKHPKKDVWYKVWELE
ncbi:MAG TPA: tRNA (adenosine(37)-N6)-dimethylallyltransferase MiaA [Candidatus Absconditabacterales bacterium]|nr:tRNA (adenosine(37)-N6)-dimethylallyltransferase MiaA [Candidatus Absconditabacterales bacterium]